MPNLILQTQVLTPRWEWGGTVAYLRIFASTAFYSTDGTYIAYGNPTDAKSFYQQYDCTVDGYTVTIPEVTIPSTSDSSVPTARLTALLFDSKGNRRYNLLEDFAVVPHFFMNPLTSSVIVTGAFTNAANGVYTWRGVANGKAYYNLDTFADSTTESAIVWNPGNSHWEILAADGSVYYFSAATSDFPWEATASTWTADTGLLPVPYVLEDTTTISSTWEALTLTNQGPYLNSYQNYEPVWSRDQVVEYVNRFQNPLPYSSSLIAGKIYVEPDPDLSTHPIAVGINNARWAGRKYLSDYDCDIAAAIDELGSTSCELVVTCSCTVAENATTPSTMLITMEGNGKFIVDEDITLRINSFSPVAEKQYFFGDGDVVLGPNAVNPIHLSWWAGLVGTADIDNTHAFEQWGTSLYLQGTHGGGTGVIGPGVWCCTEFTLPNAAFIQGAGHDPDGGSFSSNVFGTVIRLYDETGAYLWKLPTGFRNITIQDLTLTTGDAVAAQCLYNSITTTSDGFTARRVSFQSTYSRATVGAQASTFPLVLWHGDAGQQSTNNLFEMCWFQVPVNGTGFYCDTPNTSFTFNTCSPQCLGGASWLHAHNAGQVTVINPLGQGVNDYTDIVTTTNRSIAAASVVQITDQLVIGGVKPFSQLTLKADTPADKQLSSNDIFRRFDFTGEGFTGAYITEIQSPFTAILSYFPSAPITEQPCTVKTFGLCPNAAYAMFIADGNIVNFSVINGVDEGFNFSFIGGCGEFATFTFDNYYGQGRVEYDETVDFESRSCHWRAFAFEDHLSEQALDINFTGKNVFNNLWLGGLLFAQTPGVWRIQRITSSVSASYTPQLNCIFPQYDMTDGTYDFLNPQVTAAQQEMYADYGVAYNDPVLGLYTKEIHGDADIQKALLRIGHKDFLTDTWQNHYDHLRNEQTGRYQLTGNQTGQGGLVGLDLNGDIYVSNFRGGCIYPTQIAANADDYGGGVGPTAAGLYDVRNIRVSFASDYISINGLALDYLADDGVGYADGTEVIITNNGTKIGVLRNQESTSAAITRLRTCTGQLLYLMPNCSALLRYNKGAANAVCRWDTSLIGVPSSPVFEGAIRLNTVTALTAGSTVAIDASLGNRFTLTPGQAETITATNIGVGQPLWLTIVTSGTTSRKLTFSTGFTNVPVFNTGNYTAITYELAFIEANGSFILVGDKPVPTVALTSATSITVDCSLGSNFTLTPAHTATLTATNVGVGQSIKLTIVTSGSSSYTLTFGSGFDYSQGTLATGTATGKIFRMRFGEAFGSMMEDSRTIAMG